MTSIHRDAHICSDSQKYNVVSCHKQTFVKFGNTRKEDIRHLLQLTFFINE